MAKIDLIMPKMGESIMEATIIRWSKKIGERIEQDETVLEIATDKVDSEVPSPVEGVLEAVLFKDGDVIPVGTAIAVIDTEPVAKVITPEPTPVAVPEVVVSNGNGSAMKEIIQTINEVVPATNAQLATALLSQPISGRFYSPLVLNIARQEGITMDELDRIPGSGAEGRVSKQDMLAFVSARKGTGSEVVTAVIEVPVIAPVEKIIPIVETLIQEKIEAKLPEPAPVETNVQPQVIEQKAVEEAPIIKTIPQPVVTSVPKEEKKEIQGITFKTEGMPLAPKTRTFTYSGDYEIVEMDRMRKLISEAMVYSKHTSPHVTSFVECDVTNLAQWREKNKEEFEKKYNEKLTYTPLFLQAVIKALRDFPMVNSSVDGDRIIVKKDINISLAVALPNGNLIVPTVRKADQLSLMGLAAATNDLTERARKNLLKPEDITDGTYTVSNVGTFGNLMGTPVILQPQVGVLALGAIRKKPAVIETSLGEFIGIRQMMFLSHSYDHRIIDGMLGGQFVRRVADYLEGFDANLSV